MIIARASDIVGWNSYEVDGSRRGKENKLSEFEANEDGSKVSPGCQLPPRINYLAVAITCQVH